MKKYIRSATALEGHTFQLYSGPKKSSSGAMYLSILTQNRRTYSVHYTPIENPVDVIFSVSVIKPYDDASYYWARKSGSAPKADIFRAGKKIDTIILPYPEGDESPEEYLYTCLDNIVETLDELNAKVRPVMMYD